MKKAFCLIIMVFVFSVVLGMAFFMVRSSVTSDTSNFKLAAMLVRRGFETAQALTAVAATTTAAAAGNMPGETACAMPTEFPPDDSLVDFLKGQGRESSFAHRKILAEDAGIADYMGTNEQNLSVMDRLIRGNPAGGNCLK